MIGIYKITNTSNGKFYIGSSIDIKERLRQHKWQLNKNIHPNIYLQRAWNKYGKEEFIFEIIEQTNKIDLVNREQFYIDDLKPLYNLCPVAYSQSGRKQTPEEIAKRVSKLKGRKFPPEFGEAVRQRMLGKKLSKEHIKNMSISRLGKEGKYKKKVNQLSLITGELIKTWDNIRLAANTLNLSETAISNCLAGRSNHSGKYKWQYHE